RAMDRLDEALAGQVPADDKARELAKQERELADETAKGTDDAAKRRDLQQRQDKVAWDTQNLKAGEAPGRQGGAAPATIQAGKSLREQPAAPATPEKLREAADKLDQLADQLAGNESEAQRADRLARKQEAAARDQQPNPIESRRQTNQIAEETKQVRS